MVKLDDGKEYRIVHPFSIDRALVDMDGVFVLVDYDEESAKWSLSGDPATPAENAVIELLMASTRDKTVTTVTETEEP